MSETERIKERYERRKVVPVSGSSLYSSYIVQERQKLYRKSLENIFNNISDLKLMEIGAGNGSNLHFFYEMGISWKNIYANELLNDRFEILKSNCPEANCFKGDAAFLPFEETFDVVFQSTVFTSILDDSFRKKLANTMWRMLKPGGIILWYDFTYNNPNNPDVRKVTKTEVIELFKEAKSSDFYRVTLAPPIGRRVGRLYPLFNLLPFLRTHLIAVIQKA